MIKRKRLIASVVTMALLFGLMPYVLSTKPISKAADHGLSNPRVAQDNTVTWDCVYFGNYWQNDTNGDGKADQNDEKEPIKWRILSVDGDDAFLLADNALDAKQYNEEREFIKWKNCPLRTWLNDSFYNTAFTDKEKSNIMETNATNSSGDSVVDKVSLLSNIEACNASYGFNSDSIESETREAKITAYAKANGASSYKENGHWLIRPYDEPLNKLFGEIYYVTAVGSVEEMDNFFITDSDWGVRPCIHLDLSSDTWIKADTVTATGGTFATPTPVITSTPTAKPTPTPSNTPRPTGLTRPIYPTPIRINPPIKPTETETPTPTVTPKPRTITAPSKPTKLLVKNNKKKSVTLSWKKVKGAKGYQIQYATNSAFAKKKLKTTKKTKMVIKKLKKKKIYSFRVRAYKLSNNVKVYGNWSKAKKVKIKK